MSHLLSITSCGALFGASSNLAGILAIAAVVAAILFFGVVILLARVTRDALVIKSWLSLDVRRVIPPRNASTAAPSSSFLFYKTTRI